MINLLSFFTCTTITGATISIFKWNTNHSNKRIIQYNLSMIIPIVPTMVRPSKHQLIVILYSLHQFFQFLPPHQMALFCSYLTINLVFSLLQISHHLMVFHLKINFLVYPHPHKHLQLFMLMFKN